MNEAGLLLTGPTQKLVAFQNDLTSLRNTGELSIETVPAETLPFVEDQEYGQFELVDVLISVAAGAVSNAAYDALKTSVLAIAQKHGFSRKARDSKADNHKTDASE